MRTSATGRRPRLLLSMIAISVLAAAISLPTALVPQAPAGAATAEGPFHTIEVTPSENLIDGQTIDVVLRAKPGYVFAPKGQARICRDGVTYDDSSDLAFQNGNCPLAPLSSSGTTTPRIYSYADGSVSLTPMQVGVGTVEWGPSDAEPRKFSLTCDPANPCRLVIDITDSRGGRQIIDSSTLLTFTTDTAIAACGGTDPAAFTSGGSDRLTRAWVDLTKAKCLAQPGTTAVSSGVFAGEGTGHASFATGRSDLIYSAVGPTFDRTAAPPARASVSVPLALNATVIGVLGGYPEIAPDWPIEVPKPFEDLKATWPELASLFGSEPFLFTIKYEDALKQRNPELGISPVLNTTKGLPLAPAGSEAVSWFASRAFSTLAGPEWFTPPNPVGGNEPNLPRGVHDSFALADPPFAVSYIELYSSIGSLKRVAADQFLPQVYGPIFILTDFATAQELGMSTVAIPNSSGEFVRPTEESLLAAAASLELQPDGTYLPAAEAAATGASRSSLSSDAPGAYPLTFVEHAVVPTEPLVDDTCAPRAASQQLLADWLTYITGSGQAALPDGFVPLTPAMAEQAATARALVGTAATTGDCAPAPPPAPPAPTGPITTTDAPDVRFPSGLDDDFDPSSGAIPGGPSGRSATASGGGGTGATTFDADGNPVPGDEAGDGEPDEVAIAEIAYPDPTGGGGGNGWATGLALVVLAVLVAVGGLLSSGRRPSLTGKDRS